MIWSLVDLLASEYGWTKTDILENTFLDEVLQLQDIIRKRKVSDYRMQLLLQHTGKPEEMLKVLDAELHELNEQNSKLDTSGMEKLKNRMAISQQFTVR